MMAATTQPAESMGWDQISAWTSSLSGLPTREQYVDLLTSMGVFQAVLLGALGIVYLMYGWSAFKPLVIANATLAGTLVGAALGARVEGQESMQIIGALCGGATFGILAWPTMKYAVALMAAGAGSFIGYGLWIYIAQLTGSAEPARYAWAGAMVGLVALGMLTFIAYRETIILFTALQGALLAVSGGLALAMRIGSLTEPLSRNLTENVHLVPVLIIIPALIGAVFQNAGLASKIAKKKAKQPAVA